ncbi:hypothetical protein ACQEDT_10115 [Agrobacterium pusense]|uniref:hypothetical protein n=1 Tax=Agrobacterium pusense TaxID=648995 RepID=UPI003D1373CD
MKLELFDLVSKPFIQTTSLDEPLTPGRVELVAKSYVSFEEILRRHTANHLRAAWYLNLLDEVRSGVQNHLRSSILPGKVDPPRIPLLTRDGVSEWEPIFNSRLQSLEPIEQKLLVLFQFSAYCYETRILWTIDPDLTASSLPGIQPNLVAELESYGFWKTIHRRDVEGFDIFGTRKAVEVFTSEQRERIGQVLNSHAKTVLDLVVSVDEANGKLTDLISSMETHVADVTSKTEQLKTEIGNQEIGTQRSKELAESLLEQISKSDEHVKAFATAVREELKVDATKKLWNRRATGSSISFWLSAVVIAFGIFYPPYWVFKHVDEVILFLRHIGDAAVQGLPTDATAAQLTAATISRLVIITAPLAMYFWAIKLIVRFNTRSMVLMDDARQRQTTMDTYFHLVENDKATPEERGLMLNALFKPLPGQGQDNVEPPSFTDLTKRAE